MNWSEFLDNFIDQLKEDHKIKCDEINIEILKILFPSKENYGTVIAASLSDKVRLTDDAVYKRMQPIYQELEGKYSIGLGSKDKVKKLHEWLLGRYKTIQNNREFSNQSAEKLARLLLTLDYHPDEGIFTQLRQNLDYFGVFMVRGDDKTQMWLISRLARQFPCYKDAIKISIEVRRTGTCNITELLSEIKSRLIPNLSIDNDEDCIDALSNHCQHNSVIIVLSGINVLNDSQFQSLCNLWKNLSDKLNSNKKTYNLCNAGMFIFMSQNKIDRFHNINPIIELKPVWSISEDDTRGWLKDKARMKELEEAKIVEILQKELNYSWDRPGELFDEICGALDTNIKFDDVQSFWRLS